MYFKMLSERWCPFCYGLNKSRTWPHERATGCHSSYARYGYFREKATVSQIKCEFGGTDYIYIYIYIYKVKAVQPNSHLVTQYIKNTPLNMKTGARTDSLAVLGCRSNPRASTIEFLPLIDIKTKWPTFRMRHFIFYL